MTVGAVVPAAGQGTRYGNSGSKLFLTIPGETELRRSVRVLTEHPTVTDVVVVAARAEIDRVERELAGLAKLGPIVEGGATRCESVRAGLRRLPECTDMVLVHDAARPALTPAVIDAVIAGAARWGAAVPGVAVSDTVKRTTEVGIVQETVSRERLWLVQTPQGVRRELLETAYARLDPTSEPPTDEAGLLERIGQPVAVVAGDPNNLKLTTSADLTRLTSVLLANAVPGGVSAGPGLERAPHVEADEERKPADDGRGGPPLRTGIGYDVHRLEPGMPLWLGGVLIPHSHGLVGHSDADVVMHAVCDALLGAVGSEDIGTLFPNTDERNRGRASREFVAEAASVVRSAGYAIANIDVAIQAERPRIGPYRDVMRREIASAAGLAVDRIGIKATTNERLGFVGREEGIACWAVAAVYRVRR